MQRKKVVKPCTGDSKRIERGVLSWWRTRPAQFFDDAARTEVKTFLRTLSSYPPWRGAIEGDAAAAIAIVLRVRQPLQLCGRVDLTMTRLLNCAFEDDTAALVLAHMVRRTPLPARKRAIIAASWLTPIGSHAPRRETRRRLASHTNGKRCTS